MSTSAVDRALVVEAFDQATYPGPAPTLGTAWLGIYQVLWWYHSAQADLKSLSDLKAMLAEAPAHVQDAVRVLDEYLGASAGRPLLHIREANDLVKPAVTGRAIEAERYIAESMGIEPKTLVDHVDRMMRLPRWRGRQRNNPLGNGFRMLLHEVLLRWGNPSLTYREETRATEWFPGVQLAGRSTTPSIDVTIAVGHRPKAVVSCKWSIRHDRISDPTNECTAYKGAAIQQQVMDLAYVVATNELDGQRLDKILSQPCVDRVVHVHLGLVEHLAPLPPRVRDARDAGRLMDLSDWVAATHFPAPGAGG